MNVLLAVPPQGYVAQRWEKGSSMPPLGILFLAAVLEREHIPVEVVPADILGWDIETTVRHVALTKPNLVGITTTTENRFDAFCLVRALKAACPQIITVMGGPHISMAGIDTLQHVPEVDYLVVGEGEDSFLELIRVLEQRSDVSHIKGICYRDERGVACFSGVRGRIEELDSLPLPARHLIPMDSYRFEMKTRDGQIRPAQNLMTSRGCPFNCYFCATPVNWGRKMRGHSTGRVLDEIEFLIEQYGARFIWFYDDTLNYNAQRLHTIMDGIIERGFNIKFANEFRIDIIDEKLLDKMRRAGLEIGFFGVEAGSQRVRNQIVGKEFEEEVVYRFIRWSKEFDFIPGPFFIFSHHTETWQDAQETIRIMNRVKEINPQADISTALLHVYPGTSVERIAKEMGQIPKDFSWALEKDMRRVDSLPAAQGQVPLFKDRLSWWQIADLVMRWSATSKKVVSGSKIRQAIKGIRGPKDLWIYGLFFLKMLKYRLQKKEVN